MTTSNEAGRDAPQAGRWEGSDVVVLGNRLVGTSLPGDPSGTYSAAYSHDAQGNMDAMPHLTEMEWDWAQRLVHVDKNGSGQDVYFAYDSSGNRVRKVYAHGAIEEERIYLGSFELYRKRTIGTPTTLDLERETLHVADDAKRICLVETKTIDTSINPYTPTTRQRYQLDNHLGSATMELDDTAAVISYEEYFPYGGAAWHAAHSTVDVSRKRYRYNGKERDEETSLHYYGARYYAAWLGRWTSPDPSGSVDGPNLFSYVRNNPIKRRDPDGRAEEDTVGGIGGEALLAVVNPILWANLKLLGKTDAYQAYGRFVDSAQQGTAEGMQDAAFSAARPIARHVDPTFANQTAANASAIGEAASGVFFGAVNLATRTDKVYRHLGQTPERIAAHGSTLTSSGATTEKKAIAASGIGGEISSIFLMYAGIRAGLAPRTGGSAARAPSARTGSKLTSAERASAEHASGAVENYEITTQLEPPFLSRAQSRNLQKLDDIITYNAKPGDYAGVASELAGRPIPRPGGGHYDHVTEMRQSVVGLEKVARGLEGSLTNRNLPSFVRHSVEAGLRRTRETIARMRTTLGEGDKK